MTHAYKPKWSDFFDAGLGPNLPLSSQQQAMPVSGLLPSGESNGFDVTQSHRMRSEAPSFRGSGINVPFPYPNEQTEAKYKASDINNYYSDAWWDASGILKTYPSEDGVLCDQNRQSGIFHYNLERSRFSNGEDVRSKQIEDFTIFNNYIHHELVLPVGVISIPYISTFRTSVNWNPYG
jgi:hypothetical protein